MRGNPDPTSFGTYEEGGCFVALADRDYLFLMILANKEGFICVENIIFLLSSPGDFCLAERSRPE